MKINKYRRWKRIDKWLQITILSLSIIICADLLTGQTITNLTIGRLRIGNNVEVTGGRFFIPSGATATPSFSFTNDPDSGFYSVADNIVGISLGGADWGWIQSVGRFMIFDDGASLQLGVASDARLYRDAANTLAMKNGNKDQTQRWYGSNDSYFQIQSVSEYLTINAAVSTDTAMSIPANAVVRGVAVYVAVTIPTAATFTVTGATSGTTFNTAAVGTALGSNDVGTQNTPYKNGAAQLIRITPNLAPANNNGRVRVVLFYEIPSPPTS